MNGEKEDRAVLLTLFRRIHFSLNGRKFMSGFNNKCVAHMCKCQNCYVVVTVGASTINHVSGG